MPSQASTPGAAKTRREEARKEYARRRGRYRELMAGEGLDGVIVTHLADVRYLCGFSGSSGLALLLGKRGYFITDFRYREQSALEVVGMRTFIYRSSPEETLADIVREASGIRLGFDPIHVSYAQTLALRRRLKGRAVLVRLKSSLSDLRARKVAGELEIMRRGLRIAEAAFLEALGDVNETTRETDLAADIDIQGRRRGAEGPSFPTIVASGKRGALVHAHPLRGRLRGPTVVDWGIINEGYCTDCTRTVAFGKIPARLREAHAVALEAQYRAMERIKPGVRARDVDEAAREVIEKAGYGKAFGHGLGHGVGLEVHERPYVGKTSVDVIEEGMVFTIEPGIYLPALGGVRIEDMVVVGADGPELLTRLPRGLDPAEYV